MDEKNYDVIIIGAGVAGGAVARDLSKFRLSVLCLEKEADVCCGVSKANTGIIHSPALVPAGTLKAELTVKGAAEFDRLSSELGFVFQKTGALVAAFNGDDLPQLHKYMDAGRANCIDCGKTPPDYRILSAAELHEFEPALNAAAEYALWAPDAGRIIPYEYGIALWENAVENGVELKLGTAVTDISRSNAGRDGAKGWIVSTAGRRYSADYIVNAAGHGSNKIGIAAGFADSRISSVKGQYLILERNKGPQINTILFQVPSKEDKRKGKGILVTRTVYGNIMIGPDARWQDSEDDSSTDLESLRSVVEGAALSVPVLDPGLCIKTFAGIRPKPEGGDFIINEKDGFVHLCGIESPGLTSSPAIAERVVGLLRKAGLTAERKSRFKAERAPIVNEVLALGAGELKQRLWLAEGEPGRLVCRCEQVPEDRILDAFSRGLPVKTLDGIKRRTRAGQGMCQGGFCGKRVRSLIASFYGIDEDEVSQRGLEPELNRISAAEVRKFFRDQPDSEKSD